MLEYKNVYFKLLHPNGTSEIGITFDVAFDVSESDDIASVEGIAEVAKQPFLTDISQAMPESTVVMDVLGA